MTSARVAACSAPVLAWPADSRRLAACWEEYGLVVIGVQTPATPIRHAARANIRVALREALSLLLGYAPDEVPLQSAPAKPVRLDVAGTSVGISISHEPTLSIAAICRSAPVGVDLMLVDADLEWEAVALDYLGPQAFARIADEPPGRQAQAFAREWTRLEAGLKYHEMALSEWHPGIEKLLQPLTVMELMLPDGFAGTVALPPNYPACVEQEPFRVQERCPAV